MTQRPKRSGGGRKNSCPGKPLDFTAHLAAGVARRQLASEHLVPVNLGGAETPDMCPVLTITEVGNPSLVIAKDREGNVYHIHPRTEVCGFMAGRHGGVPHGYPSGTLSLMDLKPQDKFIAVRTDESVVEAIGPLHVYLQPSGFDPKLLDL